MPEHVHSLVFPLPDVSKVENLLRAIKRPYSFRIKQLFKQAQSPLLAKLTARQRPGVTAFRYWQQGPGYDRNITEAGTLEASIDYIHRNPVRRGLCERAVDWPWSSARFYYARQDHDVVLPMVHGIPPEFLNTPPS